MKCHTSTSMRMFRRTPARWLKRIQRIATPVVFVSSLGLGCSTRVPVKPEAEPKPESNGDVSGALNPRADAQAGSEERDASLTMVEGTGSVENDAASSEEATSEQPTANVDSLFSTSSTTVTTSPTSESTNSQSSTSNDLPPVPTRQLTVPLTSADAKFAVVVSVDGLAARFLEQVIAEGRAPNFLALQTLGAWTHNARTDKTHTYTLPNHTCMLTGLPVQPVPGLESYRAHFYIDNSDPAPNATLHQLRFPDHTYTPSLFDVAHDNGLSTAMFASKTKFSLFSQTYNDAGGPDTVGPDNGTRKIDRVVLNVDPAAMVAELLTQLRTLPPHLTFVHLNQPDLTGHALGWGSPDYLTAVSAMDALIGQIVGAVQSGQMRNRTALIVTTDHGGVDFHHLDTEDANNYRIPFYVLAPGVAPGDIYASLEHRVAPGPENPGYDALGQPLRNGDAGNLALDLLGLEPIPDSVIHTAGILTAL